MPEAPEITIMSEQLDKYLSGCNLLDIKFSGRYSAKSPIGYPHFATKLPLEIVSIKNKGKFIYWEFDKGLYMFNTLGLSGVWSHHKGRNPAVILEYKCKKGASSDNVKTLYFDDQVHYATVKFVSSKVELDKKLSTLGRDILNDKSLTVDDYVNLMRQKDKWNITKALMNQGLVSGIGNYIKSESLYLSGISPHNSVKDISDTRIKSLFKAIKNIVNQSYKVQGMSKRHFKDVEGQQGNFEFKLAVYGRKKDDNGYTVIREETDDKRTTYWVKEIQK